MKFCKKHTYEYKNPEGLHTTTDFVTVEDIENFHGKDFLIQWLEFTRKNNLIERPFGDKFGYYFIDYQFYAYRTKMYLEC